MFESPRSGTPSNHKMISAPSVSFFLRRATVGRLVFVACLLVVGVTLAGESPLAMKEIPSTTANKNRVALHYEVDLYTTPQRLYALLTDAKQFSALTGAPAEIDAKDGGACSLFGGLVGARNLELVPDQRIVQAWRSKSWNAGVYSVVKFELTQNGAQTRLVLDHYGFAEGLADHLDAGWKNHYLEPLAKMFGAAPTR